MNVAVIGSGAIGTALGALLARSGQTVQMIGRPAQVEAIRRDGLVVDGSMGEFGVPAGAAEILTARPDLVLLTVKTQDVVEAVRANLPFLVDVPLVALQNGVRADELVAGLVPPRRLLGGVVCIHATYGGPGRVTIAAPGSLVIGRPRGARDDEVEAAARVLDGALPTRISDNLLGARWLKLIVNLNNALPAITNLTLTGVYADPFLARLGVRLMREGLRVADRAGIELESLPDMPLRLVRLAGWLPVGLAARVAAGKTRRLDRGWPLVVSTLQSVRRGRPTEIDYLNGEVVRLGAEAGVPTPLNARVVELVHQVERTGAYLPVGEVLRATDDALPLPPVSRHAS